MLLDLIFQNTISPEVVGDELHYQGKIEIVSENNGFVAACLCLPDDNEDVTFSATGSITFVK